MARLIRNWREAATLILCTSRSKNSTVYNDKAVCNLKKNGYRKLYQKTELNIGNLTNDGYDILMLKRSSRSKFLPNVYVFPGGISDDIDFSPEWMELFNSCGNDLKNSKLFSSYRLDQGYNSLLNRESSVFSRKRGDPPSIPGEVGIRICAIRETFEESGVLIAREADDEKLKNASFFTRPVWGSSLSSAVIKEWRSRVIQEASQFLVMCRELNVLPDVWSLYEWSNWLTPIINPTRLSKNKRRFDTAFFACCVRDIPHAVEDQRETVHSSWSSPDSLLDQWRRDEVGLAGPQLYELCRLLKFHDVQQLHKFLLETTSHTPERWMGVFCVCKDVILELLPGDSLYPMNVNCDKDAVIFREETLDELKAKFPQRNRLVYSLEPGPGRLLSLDCTVQLPDNVTPVDVTLIQSKPSNKQS